MPEETPAHRVIRHQPKPVKTRFTGEDPDAVHPELDPHLAAAAAPAAPAEIPAEPRRAKKAAAAEE